MIMFKSHISDTKNQQSEHRFFIISTQIAQTPNVEFIV